MGRGRRMDRPLPSRDPARPSTTSRQPSANSTVSASRGADGRIEIAAEPARVPSVTRPPPASDATAPSKQPAAKPAVQISPTSPLPIGVHTDAAATSVPSIARTGPEAQGEPRVPAAHPLTPAAEPTARPAMPPVEATAPSQHQASVAPPTVHSQGADAPLVNTGTPHPSPSPRSPSASSGAPSSQQAPQIPPGPRHPHVLPAAPNMAAADGPYTEAGAPQVSPHAAPLQQIPPFKPKAVPAPGMPASHLPNGYGGPQQPTGSQPSLLGLNGRSRPFTPQQPHIMQQPQLHQHLLQQQKQQQQHPQQVPRRQLEKPGQVPYNIGSDPRQLQGPGIPPHMLSGQASAAEQAQSLAGQGGGMHQPQPGTSRSSSIGQKRPMPNQEMPQHHAHSYQLASPQQQRGPPNPSGPPMMPFNAPMMPFMSSPNGMPNGSMPQGANGMPFLMQGSPRPGMMSSMPLMSPLNLAMGKSAPMHQHGNPPFGANPYMQMQHMPNHINPSAPRTQTPQGPPQMHSGPQPHPQMQSANMQAAAFVPAQRSSSGSLPNGHLRSSQSAGLSPASSLGNSAKGSSTLRATAVPFIPGGIAQPPSPLATPHSTPTATPQGVPRGAGAGMAMAAPFYPSPQLAGEQGLLHYAAVLCAHVVWKLSRLSVCWKSCLANTSTTLDSRTL